MTDNKLITVLVAVVALLSLYLGYIGFEGHYARLNQSASTSDMLYRTMRLFFFDFTDKGPIPLSLDIARWLAPICLSYAIVVSILKVLSERLTKVKAHKLKNHVVISGLNTFSISLAKALKHKSTKVVVIEENGDSQYKGPLLKTGALLLTSYPNDSAVLSLVNIKQANALICNSDCDVNNITIANNAYQIKNNADNGRQLKCLVRVDDYSFNQALNDSPLFKTDFSYFSGLTFNINKLAIRWLLNHYGPDQVIPNFNTQSALSILLLGDKTLIEQFICHLSQLGQYHLQQPIDITIIGDNADLQIDSLKRAFPAINELLTVKAIPLLPEEFSNAKLFEVFSNVVPDIVYVFPENLKHLISYTHKLSLFDAAKVVINAPSGSFDDALLKDYRQHYQSIVFTNLFSEICDFESIAGLKHDRLAACIHTNYAAKQKAANEPYSTNAAMLDWEELPEVLKDANRSQADHVLLKCRLLTGKQNFSVEEVTSLLTEDNVEWLAQLEHRRWLAEKLMTGWRYTPEQKDIERKLSPSLISWEELTEDDREKDRQAVRQLPELLALLTS